MTNSAKKEELFSDDDSDEDTEISNYDERDTATLRKFQTFMKEFQNEKGDSTTTIVDRKSGCYNIQPETKESKKFFKYLKELDKVPDMMYEKQHENRGGLMGYVFQKEYGCR